MRPRKVVYIYCADEITRSLWALRLRVWGFHAEFVFDPYQLRSVEDEYPSGCILWIRTKDTPVAIQASIPLIEVYQPRLDDPESRKRVIRSIWISIKLGCVRKRGPKPLNRTALLALQAGKKAA